MDVRSRRAERFAVGAAAGLDELEGDPHALLARLRAREPVSWLPALEGWLVTRRDLAMQVMRDPRTFTVDDPRFSTGRVVGPSMLTRDGEEHGCHRDPFAGPFRHAAVHARFTQSVARETERLIEEMEPAGAAELRRSLAGPLAVAVVTRALGFDDADTAAVLGWYDRIVAAVTDITAGRPLSEDGRDAYEALSSAIGPALDREPGASLLAAAASEAGGLERERVISNAAVLLFGGIETTEGMIATAVRHLLSHPDELAIVKASPSLLANAVEESLRLEPAASRSPPPTATPTYSQTLTALMSGAATRAGTSPSRTGRTCASGCIWRAWRHIPRSSNCCTACRRCAWTPPDPAPRADSGFASRPSCAFSGPSCRARWQLT